jgi:hypothetical protein
MSTQEVGISDFFGAKNRQMAKVGCIIFKMAKMGCFLGFYVAKFRQKTRKI